LIHSKPVMTWVFGNHLHELEKDMNIKTVYILIDPGVRFAKYCCELRARQRAHS